MTRTKALTKAFRRSIDVRIKEVTYIIEGEVVENEIEKNVINGGNGGKTKRIVLKANDIEKQYDLGKK